MDSIRLAARQLDRMRGMNVMYHRRFFSDIRFTIVATIAILALGAGLHSAFFLAVPVVALLGAAQTAFDASYLIFSRHYATRLERYLNSRIEDPVLIAHLLEDAYLFPLSSRKVVTLAFGPGFSWFGWMTVLYTATGLAAYGTGAYLSLQVLDDIGSRALAATYLVSLSVITVVTVGVGLWWFVGGEGERRLAAVLDNEFPA